MPPDLLLGRERLPVDDVSELTTALPFGESQAKAPRDVGPVRSEASRYEFVVVFRESFEPLHRYLNRLSGDSDLASELAQEAFIKLYRRRSPPADPAAWLFTVATNLFRNAKTKRTNRARLLTAHRALSSHSDPAPTPDERSESEETKQRVRVALNGLRDRERSLLLLAAEGHSYREMSKILRLKEASVGTLLRRAKAAFRSAYEETQHAP